MPKTVDHDEYRKELLESCFALFCSKGYSNVTMREIAKTIGVSTGTLYHYFPNKITILEQMFAWAAERNIGEYHKTTPEDVVLPEKLDRMTAFLQRSQQDYLSHLALSLDLLRNSPHASEDVLFGYGEAFKETIIDSLSVGREEAEMVFIYLLGATVHSMLTPGRFSFATAVERLKAIAPLLMADSEQNSEKTKSA